MLLKKVLTKMKLSETSLFNPAAACSSIWTAILPRTGNVRVREMQNLFFYISPTTQDNTARACTNTNIGKLALIIIPTSFSTLRQ
jgi:hypothetical protein